MGCLLFQIATAFLQAACHQKGFRLLGKQPLKETWPFQQVSLKRGLVGITQCSASALSITVCAAETSSVELAPVEL